MLDPVKLNPVCIVYTLSVHMFKINLNPKLIFLQGPFLISINHLLSTTKHNTFLFNTEISSLHMHHNRHNIATLIQQHTSNI